MKIFKKYIVCLLYTIVCLVGCGDGYHPIEGTKASHTLALELKDTINNRIAKYGFIEDGVNMMYRYGYYMFALDKHNILDETTAQKFCDQAEVLKFESPRGMYSFPIAPYNRIMTRDDYLGTLLGAYFVGKQYQCGRDLVAWLYNNDKSLKLENDIWSPTHIVYFERAYSRDYKIYFTPLDAIEYPFGKSTCNSDKNETSNKLLLMARLLIDQDIVHTKTIWSDGLYRHCREVVDFDYTLDFYYRGDPLGELLKGTF